jgi:transposase
MKAHPVSPFLAGSLPGAFRHPRGYTAFSLFPHFLVIPRASASRALVKRPGAAGREIRHLPMFDVPVCVELRPKRYRCPYCAGHPTTTQRGEWYKPRSPNTKAYEQWALRMLINSTVADAARKLGVLEETIAGILDRWIERAVDWTAWEWLGVIGIDEIALTRGHRDCVALVTVPLTGGGVEILAVLADRKQETVAAFLRAIPAPLRHTIERTCTDMYAGFVSAIEAEVPWAEVVIDRFHVARAYRDGADTARKKALKRLKRALPMAEYAQLPGAMWPFRKRPTTCGKT